MSISRRSFVVSSLLLPVALAAAKMHPSLDNLPLSAVPANAVLPSKNEFVVDGQVVGLQKWQATYVLSAPHVISEAVKEKLFKIFGDPPMPGEFVTYDFCYYGNEHHARDNVRTADEYCVDSVQEALALYVEESPDSILISVTMSRWKKTTI